MRPVFVVLWVLGLPLFFVFALNINEIIAVLVAAAPLVIQKWRDIKNTMLPGFAITYAIFIVFVYALALWIFPFTRQL